MNLKRLLLVILSVLLFSQSWASEVLLKKTITKVASPDKSHVFTFYQKENSKSEKSMYFEVTFDGKQIVEQGELGVLVDGALDSDMYLIGSQRSKQDNTWNTVYGERAQVRDFYNELTLNFSSDAKADKNAAQMQIIVRAYNEGVAFKYNFTEGYPKKQLNITGEKTSYTIVDQSYAYYSNWAQGPYSKLPLKGWEGECERPLTLELANGLMAAIGEAAMVDYARARFVLSTDKANTLNTKLHSDVKAKTPYSTPWRTVMAAYKAIDLINNNDILLNLNEPCQIADPSWIKPGKVFRTGLTDAEVRKGIDFAAARGLQYAHLDAGWYGPERASSSDATKEVNDLNIAELCKYAQTKGVGILLYVNQRALTKQLDDILPLYQKWGVKGIKFGFVDVGTQKATTWMHEAIRKCADHGIMVDVHDEYRPTGYSRTYPNLLTQEGIRGNEEMPDAFNNTVLPYTRYLCGAGDYTPCYFSGRILTTKAHQLAMAAVYYSPFQFMFWYDKTEAYRGEKELEYWKNIPTVWDDSRAIDGQIGEFITMARRTGDDWFVGTMTNDAREVTITTDYLDKGKEYSLTIYEDNPKLGTRTNVEIKTLTIKKGETVTLELQPSGGAALHFKPKTL